MKTKIADLHVHPGLKGFANEHFPENEGRTIWDRYPRKEKELEELNFAIRGAIEEIAKESQAHLDGCAKGHLMTLFISIYPVERQMFALEQRKPFRRLLKVLLPESKYAALGAAVAGFPKKRVEEILEHNVFGDRNDGVNYYEQYVEERDYLLRQMEKASSEHPDFKFDIVRDYQQLRKKMDAGKAIAGILTVEGTHAFGHYKHHSTFSKNYEQLSSEEKELLRSSLMNNIQEVKNSKYAPFFVTFCHHFNNLLAGHARSMSDKSNLIPFLPWPNLPGMRHIFNQEPFLNAGFSELGKEVLELLLDRKNGRRILIDTKHMSIAARRAFFDYVREQRTQHGDSIPVISSHAAVSGWPTLEKAQRHKDEEKQDKGAFFSRWQINLTDEDIREIYHSDGIIGLVLHEGRMPGNEFKQRAKKLKKKMRKLAKKSSAKAKRKYAEYEVELKEHYLELLWSNIFHIVKIAREEAGEMEQDPTEAWKIIALGSDYDGIVNPFNSYRDVLCFPELEKEMVKYLESGKPINCACEGKAERFSAQEVKQLMAGRKPEEIVQSIFFDNVDRFLSKYFTTGYLERQSAPTVVSV